MKKYLLSFILLSFLIPLVTFAAWWNPLSWFNNWGFKKDKTVEVQIEKELKEKTEQSEENIKIDKKDIEKNEIEELKKEIEKLKKETASLDNKNIPVKTEVDLCSNIPGNQLQVPGGYELKYGECKEVIDVCPNISGVQEKIPEGMYFYGDNKDCLTLKEIDAIEDEEKLLKNSKVTKILVEDVECSKKRPGFYFLPFEVKGEWVSGWVQVKIKYNKDGAMATTRMDLDISNIGDGYTFSPKVTHLRNFIDLKAGFTGTYQIGIHSVVPAYKGGGSMGPVYPVYSQSSLIAEESGEFTLPDCKD